MDKPELKLRLVSSLEKVFCTGELNAPKLEKIAGVRGETVNFQIAYKCDPVRVFVTGCDVEAPDGVTVTAFNERLVPCLMPAIPEDPLAVTTDPGMFPLPLTEIDPTLSSVRAKWNALWVQLTPGASCAAGKYTLKIRLRWKPYVPCSLQTPAPEYEEVMELPYTIHDAELAPAKLICTQWFHADCLATYYRVEPWSERHWEIMENYMRDMTAHDINMLYTPLWSAPLDTYIGGERPTCQLLVIRKRGDRYEFDFSRLRRWFALGLECGFKYFEFAHAFTQWGAKATPKIVAEVDGCERRIFGWDVPADSPEYEKFLASLMPELIKLLEELGIEKMCRFHVSDEPHDDQLEAYMKAAKLLEKFTPGFVKMDALSNVELYRNGATRCPIPLTNSLAEFMAEDIPERWVYYCGGACSNGVPNRLIGIPAYRNRALGVLLYALGIDGFLHWGYNFYYTQLSRRTDIDPWFVTDAGGGFWGGDSFLVFPGKDGRPVSSTNYEVFTEALQDLRLLQTLEKKIGRDEVVKIVNAGLERPLAMTDYPQSEEWLLDLHERILARFAAK